MRTFAGALIGVEMSTMLAVIDDSANQASVGLRNAKLIDEHALVKRYLEELIENANALILVANARREVIIFNRALVEAGVVGSPASGVSEGEEEALGTSFFSGSAPVALARNARCISSRAEPRFILPPCS